MERTTLEAAEMLEEYGNKRGNIRGAFFRGALTGVSDTPLRLHKTAHTYGIFPMISIRKAGTDRLVNEEHVGRLGP